MPTRAIDAFLAHAWAITDAGMERVASVAQRVHDNASATPEALAAQFGKQLEGTERVTMRDGVATLPITGPLFAKANLMTMISGATSYDILATDFSAALADESVDAIVLKIDSPGGEVTGASELAAMIYAARGIKPIIAYVSGTIASAAYWIGSAADRIVASDTALAGSIGVQMGMSIKDPKAGEKSLRFVSSQSPMKNADPESDDGAKAIQAIVDGLASVFVKTVAVNRGVTETKVLESFGAGSVFVSAEALSRGMIDQIGTYESVLQAVKQELSSMEYKDLTATDLTANRPDLVKAITDNAVTTALAGVPNVQIETEKAVAAERARVTAIDEMAYAGSEALVAKFKAEGTSVADAAVGLMRFQKSDEFKAANKLAVLKETEAALDAPVPTGGKDENAKPDEIEESIALARAHGVIA